MAVASEIEYERKFLLAEEEFTACMRRVRQSGRYQELGSVLQINYYYDTPDLALRRQGITYRVRQQGNALCGQIKRHCSGEERSTEEHFTVPALTATVHYAGRRLTLLGQLATDRTSFRDADGIRLDFDVNYYLGVCDYELEAEYPQGMAASLDGIPELPADRQHNVGKITRFLRQLERMGARGCD